MEEVLNKEQFLNLLDALYIKVVSEEASNKLAIVSSEIKKLRESFDSNYYQFPIDKTIQIVCNLLDKNEVSYEGLRNVFRSKKVTMINEIAEAKLPVTFGKDMEKLYYDDNYVIGIHGSLHPNYVIENSRFTTGLMCIHGPKINRTVRFKEDGLDFYSFLQYQYYEDSDVNAIIIRIPRNEVCSPMWKMGERGAYFNPKYLYGYYKSFYSDGRNRSPKIIKNPNYGRDDFSYNTCDEWLPSVVDIKKKVN